MIRAERLLLPLVLGVACAVLGLAVRVLPGPAGGRAGRGAQRDLAIRQAVLDHQARVAAKQAAPL